MSTTSYTRTSSDNKDFQELVVLLDADLKIRDGDDHPFYDQFNKIQGIRNVVLCYIDGKPVGCGAFKEYESRTVEIKRMFVLPENRGKGIGLILLKELEFWAIELNYSACILETGKSNLKQSGFIKRQDMQQSRITDNMKTWKIVFV